ncbi:MAG: hypothetical protein AB2L20_14860 [Mangrovibacterium sp.]
MALKVTFDKNTSLREQMMVVAKIESGMIKIMQYVGEKFVKGARLMSKAEGGFGDDTGNLRASIGYFILKNGDIVKENLKGEGKTKVTAAGQAAAKRALASVEYSPDLQLVGVAGMDYASQVESRGLNVIAVQSGAALVDLSRMFERYAARYKRKAVISGSMNFDVKGEFR